MTTVMVLENKISSIEKYLEILDDFKKYSKKEIVEDIKIRGALERYLYLLAQATIDLSEAFIAFKNFRKNSTMSEAFDILQEEKIIELDFAEEMIKMVGFRNVIAHDYEDIDYDIVYDVLQNKLAEFKKFIEIIKDKL